MNWFEGRGRGLAERPQETKIALHDIVQLGSGAQLIVVEIIRSRPANPYLGVKVNGQGARYKFGPKHRPVVIGKADANHPALRAMARKNGVQSDPRLVALASAVLSGDMATARRLAAEALGD